MRTENRKVFGTHFSFLRTGETGVSPFLRTENSGVSRYVNKKSFSNRASVCYLHYKQCADERT